MDGKLNLYERVSAEVHFPHTHLTASASGAAKTRQAWGINYIAAGGRREQAYSRNGWLGGECFQDLKALPHPRDNQTRGTEPGPRGLDRGVGAEGAPGPASQFLKEVQALGSRSEMGAGGGDEDGARTPQAAWVPSVPPAPLGSAVETQLGSGWLPWWLRR